MKNIKPKIKHTRLDTIIVSYKKKRYELYFDQNDYSVFIGEPQEGSLITIPNPLNENGEMKFSYYKEW